MIKILKQLLILMTVVIGISMTASAQDKGDKKTPPKPDNPPVVVVKPKGDKPKEDKPKSDNSNRKKPEAYILNFRNE